MRALASVLFILVGPASLVADGRTELEILRARCNEQERQIRALETEIESLHSQIALERRRARGATAEVAATTPPAPAPAQSEEYVVKTGDTLSSISRRYHTTVDILMKQNGIDDPTRLRVGQKLVLPVKKATAPQPREIVKQAPPAVKETPKPAPPAAPPKPSHTYKVLNGDTLYGIARKHKMSLASLQALNPKLDPSKLQVGQSLAVTGKAVPPPAPRIASTPKKSASKTIATRSTSPAPKKKPTPTVAKKTPAPKPAPKPKAEPAPKPEAPKSFSSIIVMDEVSFGEFAANHGTTPEQLNALNGLALKNSVTLAKGSELYVPSR